MKLGIFSTTYGLSPPRRAYMAARLEQDVMAYPVLLIGRDRPARVKVPAELDRRLRDDPYQLYVTESGRPEDARPLPDEPAVADWRSRVLAVRGCAAERAGAA